MMDKLVHDHAHTDQNAMRWIYIIVILKIQSFESRYIHIWSVHIHHIIRIYSLSTMGYVCHFLVLALMS